MSIAGTPELANNIKEVRYDQTVFEPVEDLETYMCALCSDSFMMIPWSFKPKAQSHPAFRLRECAQARCIRNKPLDEIVNHFNMRSFFREAYRKWCHMVRDENNTLESYSFFDQLTNGLEYMPRLCSVVLDWEGWWDRLSDFWETPAAQSFKGDLSGSPLLRSWNPLYLRPTLEKEHPTKAGQGFKILMQALLNAGRTVEKFEVGHHVFGSKFQASWLRPPFARISLAKSVLLVMSQLKYLELSVHLQSEDECDDSEALGYLPLVIQRAQSLKELDLSFVISNSSDADESPRDVVYKRLHFFHIFQPPYSFPQLTNVSLSGVEVPASILSAFFRHHCGHLESLLLSDINLLDGCWEGMIQDLRLMNIKRFRFYSFNACHHRGGKLFEINDGYFRDAENTAGISAALINNYVIFGGRHPCLVEDDPLHREWEWWLENKSEKTRSWYRRWLQDQGLLQKGKTGTVH